MSEVKPHIVDLSKKLEKGMTLEKGGVITTDKDLFVSTLPEGLDADTVKKVYGHTEDVVSAMVLATANIGEDALKKDKSLDSVSSAMKLGRHGEVKASYNRAVTRTVRNIQDPSKAPEERTFYGATTQSLTFSATKNSGDLKKVRASITERAEKLFK